MQVILKRPGEVATVGELADYEAMHEYIEGHFETVPLLAPDGCKYLIVCNDEFLINSSKFNMSLGGVEFFGNIFICKVGRVKGEMDFVGLDPADILNIADNLCWSDDDRLSLTCSSSSLSFSIHCREAEYIANLDEHYWGW